MGIFDKLLGRKEQSKGKISGEKDKPNIRKLRISRDIDGLNKALEHSNKGVRSGAAHALDYLAQCSKLASESSIKPLEKALNDNYWFVRDRAASALGWLAKVGVASESSIEPLENALTDSNGAVRDSAAKALSKLAVAGVRKKYGIKKEGFEQPKDRGNIKKFGDTEYIDSHCSICGENAKLMVLQSKDTLQVVLGGDNVFIDRSKAFALMCPDCDIVAHTSTCARIEELGDEGSTFRCPRCGKYLEPLFI